MPEHGPNPKNKTQSSPKLDIGLQSFKRAPKTPKFKFDTKAPLSLILFSHILLCNNFAKLISLYGINIRKRNN